MLYDVVGASGNDIVASHPADHQVMGIAPGAAVEHGQHFTVEMPHVDRSPGRQWMLRRGSQNVRFSKQAAGIQSGVGHRRSHQGNVQFLAQQGCDLRLRRRVPQGIQHVRHLCAEFAQQSWNEINRCDSRESDGDVPRIFPLPILVTRCRARRSMANRRSDSSLRTSPAAVSCTLRLLRSKSRVSSLASSCLICRLKGGWDMCRRLAACVKLSSSATTRKDSSKRRSRCLLIQVLSK